MTELNRFREEAKNGEGMKTGGKQERNKRRNNRQYQGNIDALKDNRVKPIQS